MLNNNNTYSTNTTIISLQYLLNNGRQIIIKDSKTMILEEMTSFTIRY